MFFFFEKTADPANKFVTANVNNAKEFILVKLNKTLEVVANNPKLSGTLFVAGLYVGRNIDYLNGKSNKSPNSNKGG